LYVNIAFKESGAVNALGTPYGFYGLRGYIYYKLNRRSEALADFTTSIDFEGVYNKAESHYFRGLLNEELGKHTEACADLSKAKSYRNSNSSTYMTMEDIDKACKKCSKKLLKQDTE